MKDNPAERPEYSDTRRMKIMADMMRAANTPMPGMGQQMPQQTPQQPPQQMPQQGMQAAAPPQGMPNVPRGTPPMMQGMPNGRR